jgi:hypothetical protein
MGDNRIGMFRISAITSIVTGSILAPIASADARSPIGNAVMAAGGLGNMDWSLAAFLAGMSCYLVLGALTLFFTIARLRRQGRLSKASRHTRDQLIIRSLLILTVAASFFGSAPSVEAGPARHLSSSFHGPGKASWNLPNAVLVSSNASDIDGTYTVGNQKLSFDTLDESRSCPIILDREGNSDRETSLLRSDPDDGSRVSRLDEMPSMRKGDVDRFVRTDERALPTSNENANDGGVSDNESSEDRDDNAGFFPAIMIFAFGVISLGGGYALSIFLLTGDKKPPWKVVAAVLSLVAGIWLIGHGTNMAMDAYMASRHYHYSENYPGLRSSKTEKMVLIGESPLGGSIGELSFTPEIKNWRPTAVAFDGVSFVSSALTVGRVPQVIPHELQSEGEQTSLDDGNDQQTERECTRRVLHEPRPPSFFIFLLFLFVSASVTLGLFYGVCRWCGLTPTPGHRLREEHRDG